MQKTKKPKKLISLTHVCALNVVLFVPPIESTPTRSLCPLPDGQVPEITAFRSVGKRHISREGLLAIAEISIWFRQWVWSNQAPAVMCIKNH